MARDRSRNRRQPMPIVPGVARQDLGLPESHQIVQRDARFGQQLIEDPAHREHGRAGIDAGRAQPRLPQLSTGGLAALDDRHVESARRQQ